MSTGPRASIGNNLGEMRGQAVLFFWALFGGLDRLDSIIILLIMIIIIISMVNVDLAPLSL